MGLRDDIIRAARTPSLQAVQVEAWGGKTIYVPEMSVAETEIMGRIANDQRGRAEILCRAIRDANGVRVFRDKDLEWLSNQPEDDLEPIFEAYMKFNGFGDEQEDAAADAEKKSSSTLTADSGSGSV